MKRINALAADYLIKTSLFAPPASFRGPTTALGRGAWDIGLHPHFPQGKRTVLQSLGQTGLGAALLMMLGGGAAMAGTSAPAALQRARGEGGANAPARPASIRY